MEEGCQKSKRLSYTAQFKREVIQCAEDKGNCKAAAFFGVDETTFNCGGNTRQQSVGVRSHKRNSLDPRKDNFLKLMMQSSHSFMRDTRLDCL
jgi:transposase-like protein